MNIPLAKNYRDLDVVNGVYYPSEDGQPMAETKIHALAMILLMEALEDFFENRRDDAYIGIDQFWYWEEGNPRRRRAPDVFVAFGVLEPERPRRSFMSWREGGVLPAVIFEMASEGTVQENLGEKRAVYERQGVSEYFIFDPDVEFLETAIVAYRLENGKYREIVPDARGRYWSEQLGAWVLAKGRELQLVDAVTGKAVLTRKKKTESETLTARRERSRANRERKLRKTETKREEDERKRADAAEAELARLKALLKSRQPPKSSE